MNEIKLSIPTEYIPGFKNKMASYIKKAKKLNIEPIKYEIDSESFFREYSPDINRPAFKIRIEFNYVTVFGNSPKLKDWEFIGTIKYEGDEDLVVVQLIKGEEISSELRNSFINNPNFCEHCKSNRKRNNTYMVKHIKTGEVKQIGKSCLKDFTGHNSPENIISYFNSLLFYIEGFNCEYNPDGFSGKYKLEVKVNTYLGYVVKAINLYGYVTKSKAAEEEGLVSTTMNASFLMDPTDDSGRRIAPDPLTEKEIDITEKAIKYFFEIVVPKSEERYTSFSDFVDDVDRILYHSLNKNNGWVREDLVAYLTPIINLYLKSFDKPLNDSNFVGELKQRREFENLIFISNSKYDSDWGYVSFDSFNDLSGNRIIVKSSGNKFSFEVNEKYKILGTVSKHTTYNGLNQTTINRAKIL